MVRCSSQEGYDDGTGGGGGHKSTISGARKISITHRRNNSKDYDDSDFRHKLTHSRNGSSGGGGNSAVIKYILNNTGGGGGGGSYGRSSTAKKHSRNHSYDQIYMPNNIKVDQELHNKFNKNLSRKNSRGYDVNMLKNTATKELFLDNKFLFRKSSKDAANGSSGSNNDAVTNENLNGTGGKYHSRTNSKDLSSALAKTIEFVEETANNVLRHRRTSSKDLSVQKATGSFLPIAIEKGARKPSQHKIDIEMEQESALLRQNHSGDEDGFGVTVTGDELSSE